MTNRREFFKTAGAGLTAAGLALGPGDPAEAQPLDEKGKLDRIASCSYPIRYIFKTRTAPGGGRAGAPGGRGTPPSIGGQAPPPAGAPPAARGNAGMTNQEMKQKYGEITMLDFPQFTKDTFPGVTKMDLFSGLFGDVTDDSMYVAVPLTVGTATRVTQEFDPASASGKRWLTNLANKIASTGTKCQHI